MVPACWTQGIWTNPAIVAENAMIDEAKIGGITPAVLILSGRCVLCPPNTRRPTTRLAYCTGIDRKSTRLNSSHLVISYAVFCLKKKKKKKKCTACTPKRNHINSRIVCGECDT